MANRVVDDKNLGYVPRPPDIKVTDEGKITAQTAIAVSQALQIQADAFNGQITVGDGSHGSKTGNLDGQWITVLTPSVVSQEFRVDHGLGRLPVAILPAINDEYFGMKASNQAAWTSEVIYLKCNTASVTIRLLVL